MMTVEEGGRSSVVENAVLRTLLARTALAQDYDALDVMR